MATQPRDAAEIGATWGHYLMIFYSSSENCKFEGLAGGSLPLFISSTIMHVITCCYLEIMHS